jgi:dipeptidyl aminopeptidase/acylaminoacyl peptidase
MPQLAPFGTWTSPLTAAAVAASGVRLSTIALDGDDVFWLEGRPREGGRSVLVKMEPNGAVLDVTPPEFNVRTRVHEYGGGSYLVAQGTAYCVNFADQRIYRVGVGGGRLGLAAPEPVTPPGAWRYADFDIDIRRERLICVREDHSGTGEPINALVAVPLAGTQSEGTVLGSGADFYSTPRLSPDGSELAWLSWRHPLMPWDGTELWTARVGASGALEDPVLVAGGSDESIYQPGWSPHGTLYFASDRTGWWQLYGLDRSDRSNRAAKAVVARPPAASEFGRAQWAFGTSTWACAGPSTLVVSYSCAGNWRLATVDVESGVLTDCAIDMRPRDWIAAKETHAVLVAGSATRPDAVVQIDLRTRAVNRLRDAAAAPLDADFVSAADVIEFPTAGNQTAHAFHYPPRNKDFAASAGEQPPLIVISHGGPTAAAQSLLDLQIQYWTTRGFAVADVNYRGSTGYGRDYRQALNGQWGIADVDDVISAARFLVAEGKADARRLIIRGGSAGGYTTLAALTFRPEVFKAGASYFGISDLEALELDTHKFESQYSHRLIGPYPEAPARARHRRPVRPGRAIRPHRR